MSNQSSLDYLAGCYEMLKDGTTENGDVEFCESLIPEMASRLSAEGKSPSIAIVTDPEYNPLVPQRYGGNIVWERLHIVTLCDNQVYDPFTGRVPVPIEEYKNGRSFGKKVDLKTIISSEMIADVIRVNFS